MATSNEGGGGPAASTSATPGPATATAPRPTPETAGGSPAAAASAGAPAAGPSTVAPAGAPTPASPAGAPAAGTPTTASPPATPAGASTGAPTTASPNGAPATASSAGAGASPTSVHSYLGETLVCESFEDGKRASGIVVDENPDRVFVKIAPNRTWPVPRARITGTAWVNDAADYPKVGEDPSFDRVARGIKKPKGTPAAGQAASQGEPATDVASSAAAPAPTAPASPPTSAPPPAAGAAAHAEAPAAGLVDEERHVDARPAPPTSSTATAADPWDPYLETGGRRAGTDLPLVARDGLDPDPLPREPVAMAAPTAAASTAVEGAPAGDFTPPEGYVLARVTCRGALRVVGHTRAGRRIDLWPNGEHGYFSAATVRAVPGAFELLRAPDKAIVAQIQVPSHGTVAHVRARIALKRGAVRVDGYDVDSLAPRGQWRAGEVGLFPQTVVDKDPKTFTLA